MILGVNPVIKGYYYQVSKNDPMGTIGPVIMRCARNVLKHARKRLTTLTFFIKWRELFLLAAILPY